MKFFRRDFLHFSMYETFTQLLLKFLRDHTPRRLTNSDPKIQNLSSAQFPSSTLDTSEIPLYSGIWLGLFRVLHQIKRENDKNFFQKRFKRSEITKQKLLDPTETRSRFGWSQSYFWAENKMFLSLATGVNVHSIFNESQITWDKRWVQTQYPFHAWKVQRRLTLQSRCTTVREKLLIKLLQSNPHLHYTVAGPRWRERKLGDQFKSPY